MTHKHSHNWFRPALATWAGVFLLSYFILLTPYRYYLKGIAGIYDLLWGCNVALLLSGIGMVLKNKVLVEAAVAMVAFAHLSWIIDVTAYIVFGHFPIGTSSYVAWPETSWAELVSTMHHVWFLPLVFAVLYRNSHLPFGILKYSFFISVILIVLCRVITPIEYEGLYLNINMAHESWKDADFAVLRFADDYKDSTPYLFLAYIVLIANILNFAAFILIKPVHYLFWGVSDKELVHANANAHVNGTAAGKKAKKAD